VKIEVSLGKDVTKMSHFWGKSALGVSFQSFSL